jgi:glutamate-1-semialdehyde 2,1-aminomutase
VAMPLAERWAAGVSGVITDRDLPWTVQRLGCRAEYWFCEPPRNGAEAAAAMDAELEAWFHLYMLNRGVLMTPFHNMALMSSSHAASDIDLHTRLFAAAVDEILG